jgi:PTH1 family peptidyl-tRNA hydrolase
VAWLRKLWDRWADRIEEPPPEPSQLVLGLGNPGPRYAATRHNVGFRVVERVAERRGGAWALDADLRARVCVVEIAGRSVLLAEPQTFMNRSGESLEAALERWPGLDPAGQLLVVYDDLDLPTGRLRLRPSGSSGGHRGLGDILDRLQSRALPRLRFGVGRPEATERVIDWVLQPFSEEEERAVLPEALERAADAVEAVVRDGLRAAMGRFNAWPPRSPEV